MEGEFKRLKGDGFARVGQPHLGRKQANVYTRALRTLNEQRIPYVLAGAFALHTYTGLWRDTKDLDVFLKPQDLEHALVALAKVGFVTEIPEEHWLAKAWDRPYFVDLIFSMANGAVEFDDAWLRSDRSVEIGGVSAPLIGLEQLITSKVYIAVRDRFDGGDIAHVIRSAKGKIDWKKITDKMGDYRRLLLWHFLFFDFVYPGHRDYLPHDLVSELFEEVRRGWRTGETNNKECRGTLLDPYSFSADIKDWKDEDPREIRTYTEVKGGNQ